VFKINWPTDFYSFRHDVSAIPAARKKNARPTAGRFSNNDIFKTHIIVGKEIKEMPIVSIKIAKGRPVDIKRNLVKSITKAVASSLELSLELVTVLIEEIERENWPTGGELHSDKCGGGYGHK